MKIRVTLLGVGRVGRDVARLISARPGFQVIAAHSRNANFHGKDLGVHAGTVPMGIEIDWDRGRALEVPSDIAVISTTSFLRDVADDIRAAVASRLNVICTAEEMLYPWIVDRALAEDLDRFARQHDVTILGAGANPGFIFDAFVLTATGAVWSVDFIRGRRIVDCSHFSATILRRLGFGYTKDEFGSGVAAGRIYGHIGFPQSISLLAAKLGVEIDTIEKHLDPIIAEKPYEMGNLKVVAGQTAGFIQRVIGSARGKPWYQAEFIGHANPGEAGFKVMDSFDIEGYPNLHFGIDPGCNPHFTAAAVVANSLRRVVESKPGLVTIADLHPAFPSPTVGRFGEQGRRGNAP
jgi:2,4-diaminopentanoate dehydrogenase